MSTASYSLWSTGAKCKILIQLDDDDDDDDESRQIKFSKNTEE